MSTATPYPPTASMPAESATARRERLALLCALDRARLRLIFTVHPSKSATRDTTDERSSDAIPSRLTKLLGVASLLPGPVGRWSRRIAVGAGLVSLVRK